MIQIQDENENWIEGQPVHGQLYRVVENGNVLLESYWSEPATATATATKLTKLAFRNRFTFAEKVAIETSAQTDPVVRVLLKDQEAATFIDLSRQDTLDGVQMLVTKSLLTAERASEITSATIQPEETYRG